jgi:glutamyl-tRNA(Gln) amidotransferase subunit D
VHPALSAGDLVATVPEIADVCDVRAEVLFSIFSENMNVENWQRIAEAVADRINSGMEGCIIPHGTDTMGYTAAALSFMLDDLTRPVVLVGAQRSSDRPSSDAYTNLVSAARFIVETDAAEVFVLMHDSSSDTTAGVHRGTKVRKMHTSRRDAFHSINSPQVARIEFEGGVQFLAPYRKRSSGKVIARTAMEPNVSLLHFYPGMNPAAFEGVLNGSRGVVFAGTGLGHVSTDMVKAVRRAIEGGTTVVMTSQCLNGMVDMSVYDTGRDLVTAGVNPGGDMLPENAYVKLMWVLGQTGERKRIEELMTTDLRGELSERRELHD